MGNDGGSIAKRRDLAKQKKNKQRISCESIQKAKSKLCALSQEPLTVPIYSCKLGFLYNKLSIFSAISNSTLPSEFHHIKSSKDVIETRFQGNSNSLICPVSGIEYNATNTFFVMWNCGCAISEKALIEIKSETCLMCGSEIFVKVKLNQTKQEQKEMKKKLGIKIVKKHSEEEKVMKKQKIVDFEEIEKTHQNGMKSEVYKSLFSTHENSETFCCRHLRAGLR